MIMRVFNFCRVAALPLIGLGFGASPAAAGCGYDGCYAAAAVVVEPVVQPYYYQSGCGCGSSYYGGYYAANTYPSPYYGYSGGYAGYAGGYGYGGDPGYYRPGMAYRRY